VVITISVPGADNVSGGGFVKASAPAGTYGTGSDPRVNFGFTMKYNKSGSNLQGQANIIFRKNGVNFQIKSNAINSLSVTSYKTGSTVTGQLATFNTKANLTNLTTGASIGNLALSIQAVQSTVTGYVDMFVVTLTDASNGGLIYCNNWVSTKPVLQALGGGKINVRGVATNTCCTTSSSLVVDESSAETLNALSGFKVNVFPNPTTHNFTLDVQSNSNEEIELKVFDMLGYMVYYHKGSLKEAHHKFGQMLTAGTYTLDVRQGNNRQTIRILKK
jgi:hypothetical protein